MIWLFVALAIIALGFITYFQTKAHRISKKFEETTRLNQQALIQQSYEKDMAMLDGHILQALCQMDKVCSFYMDEDEANRELTMGLSLLGHNAQYHQPINGKRTPDIFVDNSIIEGKLDPNQSDVDRLIGQVSDYLSLPYNIIIVLYGEVNPYVLQRIKEQTVQQNPSRIKIVYLSSAQRVRIVREKNYDNVRIA